MATAASKKKEAVSKGDAKATMFRTDIVVVHGRPADVFFGTYLPTGRNWMRYIHVHIPSPFFIFSPNSRKGMLGSFKVLASRPPNVSVFLNSLIKASNVFFSRWTTLSLLPNPVLLALAVMTIGPKTVATAPAQKARRWVLLVGVTGGGAKPCTSTDDAIIIRSRVAHQEPITMVDRDKVLKDIVRLELRSLRGDDLMRDTNLKAIEQQEAPTMMGSHLDEDLATLHV
jgi:hypothetical protein